MMTIHAVVKVSADACIGIATCHEQDSPRSIDGVRKVPLENRGTGVNDRTDARAEEIGG